MKKNSTTTPRAGLALACLLALTLTATAKRPVPTPEPTPIDGGTLYYRLDTSYFALADGVNSVVPLFIPDYENPVASKALHAGKRWFAYLSSVENPASITLASDAGDSVVLVSDPFLKFMAFPGGASLRWMPGDSAITVPAARLDGSAPGLYVIGIDFSSGAPVATEPATQIPWTEPLTQYIEGYPFLFEGYDWSPDGTQLVYGAQDAYTVCLADASGAQVLVENANNPRWSPDGTTIAYTTSGSLSIEVIGVDGTGRTTVAAPKGDTVNSPTWSPSGTHLAYADYDWGPRMSWCKGTIYVVSVADRAKQPLTGAVESAGVLGWAE